MEIQTFRKQNKERKKKVSAEKEYCLLPRGIFVHTRTYSHIGKKKEKRNKRRRKEKRSLVDGQEG